MTLAAIILLIVGSAADSFTTWRALTNNPRAREANPIMRKAIEAIGLVPLVIARFAFGCVLAWYVGWADETVYDVLGLLFGAIYCAIAVRNWGKA